jgi:transcriptional regulator with XRE-family HTH domain
MTLYELGQALKVARINQSITQQELAERTGVSVSTISGLERGTLAEIGVLKLLQLFALVGLELQPRPAGQRRTLDDVAAGASMLNKRADHDSQPIRQRVRVSAKKVKP